MNDQINESTFVDPWGQGTAIEVVLELDLGVHAPSDLLGLAESVAFGLHRDASLAAAVAAEASGSEEVDAAPPVVRYRAVGVSEWQTIERSPRTLTVPRGDTLDIPCTYTQVPDGYTIGRATNAELHAAGFYSEFDPIEGKPGWEPLDEMLVDGLQMVTPEVAEQILATATVTVLLDPDGTIVATWDEGRWWTPAESDEFMDLIVGPVRGRRSRRPER